MKKRKAFLPYNLPSIGEEEINEEIDTLKSGWITMGPKTVEFEKQISEYIGSKHAVCVNSCTAGLGLSLFVSGIKQGDEVIVPTLTFAATANEVYHRGAKPVFCDIQKDSFNIDPEKIEEKISEKTKAIIVVHYGGQAADMKEIDKIATRYNLKIIEDAAHAIGCEYNGKKIGSFGPLTSFSFYATKNITTGEGGCITLNSDEIAEKLRILRLHGISKDAWKRYGKGGSWFYEVIMPGFKYNMSDMQAALGIHQLKKLDSFNKKRQEYAKIYNEEFSKIKGITTPVKKPKRNHIYHLYPILLENYERNKFIQEMEKRNIGTSVHFIPLHIQPFYRKFYGYKLGDFPVAEQVYNKLVTLPLYPKMQRKDIDYVIEAVKDILNNK